MEDLLAREQAAYKHVLNLMKSQAIAPEVVNQEFSLYREICLAAALAAFPQKHPVEDRQWQLHAEGRKYFSSALRKLRKSQPERPVETRKLMKEYLRWIKDSQSAYRDYIFAVCQACNGIPQFETIAHKLNGQGYGESQPSGLSKEQCETALAACHRALVYLGDLSRYRAMENLDQKPNFGPAIGYYDLADATIPKSGLGHHQQAVVSLENKNHLLAIYHLYRSISVEAFHPLGSKNLKLEFQKVDAARDRNELIHKGPPNDPDASHRALIGFFVHMHSMCYKGERFPAHEELEREILGHLSNIVRQCAHSHTVMRMVITNIAAQYVASQQHQEHNSSETMLSFFLLLRFNLRTFTTLLRIFYDDLYAKVTSLGSVDVELSTKLTPLSRYLLPVLRVYHDWLSTEINVNVLVGLQNDDTVGIFINEFWTAYARAIDLVAQAFPIWDLDDIPQIDYLLEEDCGTLAFLPLQSGRTAKTWFSKQDGSTKPRFSDLGVVRFPEDEEMLRRIQRMLDDGTDLATYLAEEYAQPPLRLRQTRFYTGTEANIEDLVVRPFEYKPIAPPKVAEPVSYAAAAAAASANTKAKPSRPSSTQQAVPVKAPASRDAQAAQLSRMVDDLLDEDDGSNPVNDPPVTPPQQATSNPAVVPNGENPHTPQDSMPELLGAKTPITQFRSPMAGNTWRDAPRSPHGTRPGSNAGHHDRMQGVSRIWDHNRQSPYSSFPSGLPTGTLGSPPLAAPRGHSRVNSASSVRSRSSLNAKDPWASMENASRNRTEASNTASGPQSSLDQIGMGSPLLFGALNSPWSTGLQPAYRNVSPPNGHGG